MGATGLTRNPHLNSKTAHPNDPTAAFGFTFTSFELPRGEESRRYVDLEHIENLTRRPAHKGDGVKYRSKNGSVDGTYARQISPLTMEDKFSKFDLPWISNLRRENSTGG